MLEEQMDLSQSKEFKFMQRKAERLDDLQGVTEDSLGIKDSIKEDVEVRIIQFSIIIYLPIIQHFNQKCYMISSGHNRLSSRHHV